MNEFDKLWECAANLHSKLNREGDLMLSSVKPFKIDTTHDPYVIASGETPTDAVRNLLAVYISDAKDEIDFINRRAQEQTAKLQQIIDEAKRNGC